MILLSEDRRDSLRSLNSAFSLEYIPNPTEIMAELDGTTPLSQTDVTDLDSNEATPMKGDMLFNGFEFDDEEMPSRKRRASHRHDPHYQRDESSLENISTASRSNSVIGSVSDSNENSTMVENLENISCSSLMNFLNAAESEIQVKSHQELNPESTEFHLNNHHNNVMIENGIVFDPHQFIQNALLERLGFLDRLQVDVSAEPPADDDLVFVSSIQDGNSDDEPRLGIYNETEREERLNATNVF